MNGHSRPPSSRTSQRIVGRDGHERDRREETGASIKPIHSHCATASGRIANGTIATANGGG